MNTAQHTIPLSVGQEAMRVAWELAPDAATHIIPLPLLVRGTIDPDRLRTAVEQLGTAFPHLRARVTAGPDGNRLDWSDAPAVPVRVSATRLDRDLAVRQAWQVPFDLRRGPLARVELIDGPDWTVLLLVTHHLVSDGASVLLLLDALRQAYAGEPITVPDDPAVLERHARRSVELAETDAGSAHREYWRRELGSGAPDLPLPAPADEPRYTMVSDRLPADLSDALRHRAQAAGVSYVTALLAGYYALLRRYSGAADILSFLPFHGRIPEETRQQIGYFVNPLPIRCRMAPSDTYTELLQQVRGQVKAALLHGELPLPAIMRAAGLVGPQARELTHRSVFQFWHAGLRDGLDVQELPLTGPDTKAVLSMLDIESSAGFTLAVMVREDSAGTHVLWKDPAGALGRTLLTAMAADYQDVLWTIAEHPDAPLADILAGTGTAAADTGTPDATAAADAATVRAMVEVWEEVLGIDGIGPEDSFFELGGHSLLAESLVIGVARRFGREVPLTTLFDWPRLGDFTAQVLGHRS
ncbi:condensation domain-containing protein [Streptomyces sp. NPDC001606]